jgi:hypothetical protein
MEYSKLENITIEGINMNDYPDFADAYISHAEINGIPLTNQELESISDDFVHELVLNRV